MHVPSSSSPAPINKKTFKNIRTTKLFTKYREFFLIQNNKNPPS
jgi:hypothetical protein